MQVADRVARRAELGLTDPLVMPGANRSGPGAMCRQAEWGHQPAPAAAPVLLRPELPELPELPKLPELPE